MRKRHIISSLIAASVIASSFSAAAETVTVDNIISASSGVTLTGHIETAVARTLTAQVIIPGGVFGAIDDIYRIDTIKTDDTGSFAYSVSPDETDWGGIYTIYIGGRDITEPASQSFTFISFKNREDMIAKINSMQNVSELKNLLSDEHSEEIIKSLGFNYEKYNAFSDAEKEMYCEILLNKELSVDNFDAESNLSFALTCINTASIKGENVVDKFRENASVLGIELGENTIADWLGTKQTDEIISNILSGQSYTDAKVLSKTFNEAVIVKAFSSARWNELEKIISICNDYVKLDIDNSVYKSNKNKVYKYMVDYKYEKFDDIQLNFNKALMALTAAPSEASGGGSGSGSSPKSNKPTGTIPAGNVKTDSDNTKPKSTFTDLSSVKWAAEYIEKLAAAGVISGDGTGKFDPNRVVTREEYVKMLVCAFKLGSGNEEMSFSDIKKSDWFFNYIKSGVSAGIVKGTDNNTFGAGKEISREDMAVMTMRTLEKTGVNVLSERSMVKFTDEEDISDYAKEAIEKLYCAGIINGFEDGSFMPKATATRAQAAIIIASAMQMNGEEKHD